MRYLLCNSSTPDGVHCASSAASARVPCRTPATTRLSRRKRNAIDNRHVAELQLFQTMRNTSKILAFYLYGRSCFLSVLPGAWGVVMGVGAIRNRCVRSACVAATLFAAPALAAELSVPLPVKATRPVEVPVIQPYDWTGFYVGVHFGQGWGKSHWTLAPDASGAVNFFNRFDAFETTGGYFGGLQLGDRKSVV